MNLHTTIREKFINEVANTLIDSTEDYSDYIKENNDLEYYHELVEGHLIGYYKCEMFLTNEGHLSGFEVIGDYIEDYTNTIGEKPNGVNSEMVYQFYFDTFLYWLVDSIDMNKEIISQIEHWRAEQIEDLYKF